MNDKYSQYFLLRIILICLSFFPLIALGQSGTNDEKAELEAAIRKLSMAQIAISSMYVDSVDKGVLTEDAIRGMLSELDPHSSYTNAKETQKINESLSGSFDGIGVQFNILDDTLLVIQPVTGGPSERVGIIAGDRIVGVNDTAIAGVKMSKEEMMRRLRGPKNTQVKLDVTRRGINDKLTFIVTRDKISTNTVDAVFMLTPTIGFIRLSSFGATSHDELVEALCKLKDQGMKDLILDLTANGGGYLDAAITISEEFLPQNDLIVYTQGLRTPYKEFRARGGGLFEQGRVVVLVDEYSASAAEIVTGALQDQDRGIVVGRRTFGKGLVQKPFILPDGSMIRLTVARYYTPSGRCIQKPYVKGDREKYRHDVIDRYENGELTSVDSIHLSDSLKYKTLRLGRVVYGGGGIMPDHFVPLDTTHSTTLSRKLTSKGCVINACLKYIDKERKQIQKQYPSFKEFKANYTPQQELIEKVLGEGELLGIRPESEEELSRTLPWLEIQLKALLARDIWDISEYFEIIYVDNILVKKAIEILANTAEITQ